MNKFIDSKHEGGKRRFIRTAKAWYSSTALPDQELEEFSIGVYHDEGGTTGEFSVRWERLGGRLVPKLRSFDGSWSALLEFSELLGDMAKVDGNNITPDEFNELLLNAGIEDATAIEDPNKTKFVENILHNTTMDSTGHVRCNRGGATLGRIHDGLFNSSPDYALPNLTLKEIQNHIEVANVHGI